jgi:hypothetical protein
MNTVRLAQSRRLFASPYVHPQINRNNARKWIRSLRALGDKWVLLQHVAKEMK